MGKLEQDFAAYRARMNERVLAEDNRVIKRVYSVDSLGVRRGRVAAEADQGTARPGCVPGAALRRLREIPPRRGAGRRLEPQGTRRGHEHRPRRGRHDRDPAPAPRGRVPRRPRRDPKARPAPDAGRGAAARGRKTSASMQRTEPPPVSSIVGTGTATTSVHAAPPSARARRARGSRGRAADTASTEPPAARPQLEQVAGEAAPSGARRSIRRADRRAPSRSSSAPRSPAAIALGTDHREAAADREHHVRVVDGRAGRGRRHGTRRARSRAPRTVRAARRRRCAATGRHRPRGTGGRTPRCRCPRGSGPRSSWCVRSSSRSTRKPPRCASSASSSGRRSRRRFGAEHRIEHGRAVGMQTDPVVREHRVGAARLGAIVERVHLDAGSGERRGQPVELGQRPWAAGPQPAAGTLEAVAHGRLRIPAEGGRPDHEHGVGALHGD